MKSTNTAATPRHAFITNVLLPPDPVYQESFIDYHDMMPSQPFSELSLDIKAFSIEDDPLMISRIPASNKAVKVIAANYPVNLIPGKMYNRALAKTFILILLRRMFA